jgi:hypothetical protein
MINPELIRGSNIFSSSEICDINGAVYYTKTYNFHIDPHRYSNHSIMYMPPTITTNSQVSRDEFMSLLTSDSYTLEDIELFIHSGDYLFQVLRGYDESNYRYYFTLKEYKINKKSEKMETYYEFEVKEDKRLRKELDDKIQEIKSLPVSRERDLSITKLQEAVMWLGMDLKRLGESNPYPSSKDPSTGTKIEPTADGLKF